MKIDFLCLNYNLFRRWFCFFAVVLTVVGCASEDETEPYLNVYPTSLVFDERSPDANVVAIEANGQWTVTGGAPAPEVDVKIGYGDGLLRVLDAPQGQSSFTVSMGLAQCRVLVTRLNGGDPDPDPNPNPDPTPDPDPTPGEAVFGKAWAELPAELVKAGDYYYTYHMRPDAPKVRNFAVCYSRELMCPVWVAAPMHPSYKGNARRTDAYAQDPSLGFTQPGKWSGYTRGHMLGSSDRTVSTATNRQVFYYSNIAPQLQSGFNTGGGAWNNLEEFTDDQWCADTLYQVVGCYWADKDKRVDKTVIPTHYYKILLRTKRGNTGKSVAACTADELKCAAFVVAHKSQRGLKPNASMMKSVRELELVTGFTFFPNVPQLPKDRFNPADWGL